MVRQMKKGGLTHVDQPTEPLYVPVGDGQQSLLS